MCSCTFVLWKFFEYLNFFMFMFFFWTVNSWRAPGLWLTNVSSRSMIYPLFTVALWMSELEQWFWESVGIRITWWSTDCLLVPRSSDSWGWDSKFAFWMSSQMVLKSHNIGKPFHNCIIFPLGPQVRRFAIWIHLTSWRFLSNSYIFFLVN